MTVKKRRRQSNTIAALPFNVPFSSPLSLFLNHIDSFPILVNDTGSNKAWGHSLILGIAGSEYACGPVNPAIFEAISIDIVFQIHYAQKTGLSCPEILVIHAMNTITDEAIRHKRDVKQGGRYC